jgi:hypothetical protein
MMLALGFWILMIALLAYFWGRKIGIMRGIAAALLRAGWTLPIMLSLFPVTISRRIPGAMALQPIHILLDDSESMSRDDAMGASSKRQAQDLLNRVSDVCRQFGCLPRVTKLSDLSADTKFGYTPLSRIIEPWLYQTGGDPWIILSDGGDFRPSIGWAESLQGRGAGSRIGKVEDQSSEKARQRTLGLITAFGKPRAPGFSVEALSMAPLAFEGKSVQLGVTVDRLSPETAGAERVQVQALLDGKVLTAAEAVFSPGASSAEVDVSFAAPKRGPHIVSVRVLPVAGELDTWDNSQTRVLDVMPNTVGVLHLLGSPAWDGRFMRRFLKAEPKFDVISFFILRDPWDTQHVSEREMSLIPFPVERLFNEELVNFRVIVMQNFTLMRFLQPEYQKNLAKFVKDGGGLLFVGGPRALTETDASSSALSELLPFTINRSDAAAAPPPSPVDDFNDGFGSLGSTWSPNTDFKIEMANPEASRRALANVYEGWQGLSNRLETLGGARGIHDMNAIKFRDNEVTPLLNAKLPDGRSVPLAVASYPGKGRAIWLFTDSIWRMAMSSDPRIARSDYHSFLDHALVWLTKGDLKGALAVRDFQVTTIGDTGERLKWRAALAGSAARYLRTATSTKLSICGIGVMAKDVAFGASAGDAVTFEGELAATLRDGSLCALKLEAEHPAFGSVSVSGWAVIPETLKDENIGSSAMKLRSLAKVTGAKFVDANSERSRTVEEWLQGWGASDGASLPDKIQTFLDYYWVQDAWWIWLTILLLPIEVLVRRWHLIFGGARQVGLRG